MKRMHSNEVPRVDLLGRAGAGDRRRRCRPRIVQHQGACLPYDHLRLGPLLECPRGN